MQTAWRVGALALALLTAGAASPAMGAEKGLANKGEVLIRENCSRCHAMALVGDSLNAEAPPFRTLARKYPIENLAESLAEGIVSGHPEMPIFVFKPHDVDAILAYLESIQQAPEADPEETLGQ